MTQPDPKHSATTWQSILPAVTLGCSLLVLLLLGTRSLTSYDLGYHLAFGETFFNSGTIVDHTPFIYTLPALNTPESARPEPGPGSWYDHEGRYRFTNSSWLSQLFIFGAWHLAGAVGLNLLQLIVMAGFFSLLIIAMRKSRVPLYLISFALLLIGMLISSRLNMRPELFGYVCIMTQFMLLAGLAARADRPAPPSWPWVGGMIIVQVLCINLHSFFILGLAITGAVLAEYIILALKNRLIDKDISRFSAYSKTISRLGMTLTAMIAACFVNPWGWRLVLQPFQTMLYMKKYGIGGPNPGENAHPWDHIIELRETISGHWPMRLSDYAVMVMMVVAAAAVLLQLTGWMLELRRKRSTHGGTASRQNAFRVHWSLLFMIAGMLFVGLQMRRNVGVASLIIVPSALICITEGSRNLLKKTLKSPPLKLFVLANTAVIALSIFGGYQIISGKLYEADAQPTRFGFGLSEMILPIGATSWLNEHAPDARVWCDFQSSSTLHFFSHPHKEVPILTNTWAFPPSVMASNIFYLRAKVPFGSLADKDKIDAVVLRSDWSLPLHRQLAADPEWKMVHVEGVNVLFLRAKQKYGPLAARFEIKPGNFDTDTFAAQQVDKDPSFDRAILSVSDTLLEAGEEDLAIDIIESGLKYLPPDIKAWKRLLALYTDREAKRRARGDKRGVDDIRRMKFVLERILELKPGDEEFQKQLDILNRVFSLLNSQ